MSGLFHRLTRPRGWWRILLPLATVGLLGGHIIFWYLPRERPGVPDPDSPSGRLFFSSREGARIWLPWPHQNLGHAAAGVEDLDAFLDAAGRLSGGGQVSMPRFGPFSLPPASSLAVATSPQGERVAMVVEVYPVLAVVARLAGWVARNPILGGGPVVLDGRSYEVVWRGRSWSLGAKDLGAEGSASPALAEDSLSEGRLRPEEGALAWAALSEAFPPLPSGLYRLQRKGQDLVLQSGSHSAPSGLQSVVAGGGLEPKLALLGLRRDEAGSASVLVLPNAAEDGRLRLPDAAVLWTAADSRWSLPGESVQRLLGFELLEDEAEGWGILALEEASLDLARELAGPLRPLSRGDLHFGLWFRPAPYRRLVATVADVFDSIPLVSRSRAQFWRDLDTVLRGTHDIESVSVAIDQEGAEIRLNGGPVLTAPREGS